MAKDEIVDTEQGPSSDTFVTGIVIFTTVALFAGFLLIESAWGTNYGRGLFGS
jgi:hypothetical protein